MVAGCPYSTCGVSAWAVTYVFLGVIELAYARSPVQVEGCSPPTVHSATPPTPYVEISRALVTAAVASSNHTVLAMVQDAAAPAALWPVYVLE